MVRCLGLVPQSHAEIGVSAQEAIVFAYRRLQGSRLEQSLPAGQPCLGWPGYVPR